MNRIILFIAFIVTFYAVGQQSKAKLEAEKREHQEKLQEAGRILEQTNKDKTASLGQLNALDAKIKSQSDIIKSVSSEVIFIEKDISEVQQIIESMEKDMEALRKEYAKMIYTASKTQNEFDRLSFIFSAESFNQAMMRFRYLKQYSDARRKQAEVINEVKKDLEKQELELKDRKLSKNLLLNSKQIENKNLEKLKLQKKDLVAQLSLKEKELKKDMKEREKALSKLDKLISDLLKKAAKNTSGRITVTPEIALASSKFEGNRRKLNWPVKHGFISQKFGLHPHPVLHKLTVENLGVDIQTNQNEAVRCVFPGVVTAVAEVPGMDYIVMIQHGEYFTVYAKLKEVIVKSGQTVKEKQTIGTVSTGDKNVSEVQFQIWKNSDKLNPEQWLYKK